MEFYIQMAIAIVVGILIAWGIIELLEHEQCNRAEGGYNCHGANCEGCYRIIGGRVEYSNPQPANNWGEAELAVWI